MNKIAIAFVSIAIFSFGLIYIIDQNPLKAQKVIIRDYLQCLVAKGEEIQNFNLISDSQQGIYNQYLNVINAKEIGKSSEDCVQLAKYILTNVNNPYADINYKNLAVDCFESPQSRFFVERYQFIGQFPYQAFCDCSGNVAKKAQQ